MEHLKSTSPEDWRVTFAVEWNGCLYNCPWIAPKRIRDEVPSLVMLHMYDRLH
jgi:hypothetical protein